MPSSFSDWASRFSQFGINKRITCSSRIIFWNISRIYFCLFNIKNILSYSYTIFLNFFQSLLSAGKYIPSQLYLFIKCLIFVILSECFLIYSWFNATVPINLANIKSHIKNNVTLKIFPYSCFCGCINDSHVESQLEFTDQNLLSSVILSLYCLMSTKRSHILKESCSFQPQVV